MWKCMSSLTRSNHECEILIDGEWVTAWYSPNAYTGESDTFPGIVNEDNEIYPEDYVESIRTSNGIEDNYLTYLERISERDFLLR